MLRERYFFNESLANCSSEESAVHLKWEKENLEIPEHLQFPRIAPSIAKEHQPSIEETWNELVCKKRALDTRVFLLNDLWNNPPETTPSEKIQTTQALIDKYPIPVPIEHKDNILHTVIPPSQNGEITATEKWQGLDFDVRGGFQVAHRDYMVTLRLYYELLLEENIDQNQTVIPYDNPLRAEIAHRNDMVRIINTSYQCIQISKSAHHEQKKGRLRKHEKIPYAMHTQRVTLACLEDTVPYMTGAPGETLDPILLAAVAPIHDTVEDTPLALITVLNRIAHRADHYDSSIDARITLNFDHGEHKDEEVEAFKKSRLNLINRKDMRGKIEAVLRILTDNDPDNEDEGETTLSDEEISIAIQQNLFGEEQTLIHLGLLPEDLPAELKADRIRQIKHRHLVPMKITGGPKPPCKTAQAFGKDNDNGKLTRFLIRANAIAAGDKKKSRDKRYAQTILQHALIVKFNDRANNLLTKPSTDEGMRISKLKDLRNAVERLIAYAIYDYDNQNYPLYNALPRLIHACLMTYRELDQSHSEIIEPIDREYIQKLEIWAKGETEITRFRTNEQVHKVMEEFAAAKKDDQRATRGSIYQFEQQAAIAA
jgi:hypothetical protein